jgi:hypothetical protein
VADPGDLHFETFTGAPALTPDAKSLTPMVCYPRFDEKQGSGKGTKFSISQKPIFGNKQESGAPSARVAGFMVRFPIITG